MRITLTVTAGPNKGKVYSFTGHDTFIVGRSKKVHFPLPTDRYFSRFHFMVEVNPPQCRLMDMESRNGTFVNEEKVGTADLKDGDKIRAGRTILRVQVEEQDGEAAPAEGDETPTLASIPVAQAAVGAPSGSVPIAANDKRPPTPITLVESCRVCGAELSINIQQGNPRALAAFVCAECKELVRSHEQPIQGYQIVKELGRGGLGVVYLAIRSRDGKILALKTIIPTVAPSQTEIDRFIREANILKELKHPNIVGFHETGESNDQLYFAMDYVRGIDAHRILREGGRLEVSRAAKLVCQLLEALEYAHEKGFVHRDIKPANLLVTDINGRETVKLADFGLARTYQNSHLSGLTITGSLGGTAAFMPPEQILNFRDVQPSADQYSAAATLYNLLTEYYIHDLPQKLQQQILLVMKGEAVPIQHRRPDLSDDLSAIIHRALDREPDKRFPNVGAFRKELERFV